MTAPTPGPWRLSDTSIVTDEVCIAVLDAGEYGVWGEEQEANGALMAAAPELLTVAEDLLAYCRCVPRREDGSPEHHGQTLQELYYRLQAAVAEARGEDQP